MQLLTKGIPGKIRATLEELTTLPAPFYLFVFNYPGQDPIKVILDSSEDLTPEGRRKRLNEFSISADLFEDAPAGNWTYKVYEQASPDNLNPEQAGALVERGILQLNNQAAGAFTQYSPDPVTPSSVYNG
jgi:hypothetical protein